MAWQLHLYSESNTLPCDRPIGAVWACTIGDNKGHSERAWMVRLPGEDALWHTLQCQYDRVAKRLTDRRWNVTIPNGDPTRMTVSPSIDIRGGWHGFIENGVISDDVSGKRF